MTKTEEAIPGKIKTRGSVAKQGHREGEHYGSVTLEYMRCHNGTVLCSGDIHGKNE